MALMDYIPYRLREPLENADFVAGIIAGKDSTMTMDSTIQFLEGVARHQESVLRVGADGKQESKVFKAKVVRVELIERNSGANGSLLGKKCRIVYEAMSGKNQGGEEFITTGFLTFYGRMNDEIAWEVALTRSILADLENSKDGVVYIRKAFAYVENLAQGNRVKYVANLNPEKFAHRRCVVTQDMADEIVEIVSQSPKNADLNEITDRVENVILEGNPGKTISGASDEVVYDFVSNALSTGRYGELSSHLMGFFPEL